MKSKIKLPWDFEPTTIGEHLKKRRLFLKLFQKQLATILGVDEITIVNWEKGKTKPGYRYLPSIIEFLGYDPEPVRQSSLSTLLKAKRKAMGWTIKAAAGVLGVDPDTWARWEEGRVPRRGHVALMACLFKR